MLNGTMIVIEEPNKGPREFTWSTERIRQLGLEPFEVKALEKGEVVWRGDVAYSLESET